MPNCSVFSCKKRSDTSSVQKDNITFHLFPKVAMIRDIWTRACANHFSWTPKRTSTICSQHFETSCFITQSSNKRKLKQYAVPTLELPKVRLCEEPEPGTSSPKIETFEDSLPSKTEECKSTKDQPYMSQSDNHNLHLSDTSRTIKLKKILKKKVAEMQEMLNGMSEKSVIIKENHLVLNKIGVEEKEKSIPHNTGYNICKRELKSNCNA
ncbi:THAP domain-containing protein 1-like [Cydia pomonella]|uniref:THAP domain-containing protein 1-like n=1 Tax=Cydia pomonella TaxID=82600 RepID=UPI002ADDF8BD|nr:THAP domain-containing protein 1-like [Cydia pomonella]